MTILALSSIMGHPSAEALSRDHVATPIEIAEAAPPLPKPRPDNVDTAVVEEITVLPHEAPLPRPRPEGISAAEFPEAADLSRLSRHEHSACMRELDEAGVSAEVLPEIRDQYCGMRWPLRLDQIGEGVEAIDLSPAAKVRCPIAEALLAWMDSAVQPAAKQYFGARVTGLRIASSYVCRARNHAPGARLSEHALGNAIDISAFKIDEMDWVAVGAHEDDENPEAQFLSDVRKEACTHFHTVLGPGTGTGNEVITRSYGNVGLAIFVPTFNYFRGLCPTSLGRFGLWMAPD